MVESNYNSHIPFISLCCQRSLKVFDANLSLSKTHNYICLTVRLKQPFRVRYRARKYVKPKINLPNREKSRTHPPRWLARGRRRTVIKE